jgi:hypothetical protein
LPLPGIEPQPSLFYKAYLLKAVAHYMKTEELRNKKGRKELISSYRFSID